jgi:hypothetical protein
MWAGGQTHRPFPSGLHRFVRVNKMVEDKELDRLIAEYRAACTVWEHQRTRANLRKVKMLNTEIKRHIEREKK